MPIPSSERPASCSARALLPAPAGGGWQNLEYELAVAALRAAGFATDALEVSADAWTASQAVRSAELVYLHLSSRKAFRIGMSLLPALSSARPRPILLAGGAFASDHAPELLAATELLDGVVAGEIEETLVAVARAVEQGQPWWNERGLWHRREGPVRRTPPRPLIDDLNTLPKAATDLVRPGESTRRQVLVSRGCNSNCSYCTLQVPAREAFPGRQLFWRSRSPRAVVDEVEHLWRHNGIERFAFHSHVFFGYDQAGTRVAEGIARELLSRDLPVRFSFVTHPGHLRRNVHLLPLLRQAGLDSVFLGIDSILDRARSLYRLPFDREDIWASLAALHDLGIQFQTGYIFYDPYTTLDEIEENLSFLRAAQPMYRHLGTPYALLLHHQIVNTFLTLNPRMPIVERLRSHGLLQQEGSLEGPPVARFLDRRAGRFAHLHRRLNQEILRPLAPLVFHPGLEERCPHLACFLVEALETLRHQLLAQPDAGDHEVLHRVAAWCREALAPAQDLGLDPGVVPSARQAAGSSSFQEG